MSMQGLEGVKVLELGDQVSAAYATKIMADLGADVIKVEEPNGDHARRRGPFPKGVVDPEQSGLFLYLNTNKRGCTCDLGREKDTLRHLVAWADILVHNYPPAQMVTLGIDYNTFREINPRLVMTSITPFGLTGPHKDYKAYELTIAHGGGLGMAQSWRLRSSRLTATKSRGTSGGFSRWSSCGHCDARCLLPSPADRAGRTH